MIWIEYESDLKLLNGESIKLIAPIWSSPKGHEWGFPISFVYIRSEDKEFIINFQHIDTNKITPFDVGKLAGKNTLVLGHRYLNSLGLDYEWVYFETYKTPFIFDEFVASVYSTHRTNFVELNDCVPIMKWVEILRQLPIPKERRESDRYYSDAIRTLGLLEKSGVSVDSENFIKDFEFPKEYIHSGFVYTKYNPYTITGRPSNRHLSVNWSALNKSDGTRRVIKSRFDRGTLIQFDFESFHLRLIAKLVGYEFPTDKTAHEHLAEWYGDVDRETAKGITFRYLYGGLDDLGKTIPFFVKVDEFIKKVYRNYVVSGKLTTPILHREISFERIGRDAGEQKVFNYFLQALETEVNYHKMNELLELFEDKKSKFILYTYDAFLIDTEQSERVDVLREISKILEKGGFPVKVYEGKNYDELEFLS